MANETEGKLRIVLITAQWIHTKGGPSRYVFSLARELSAMGFPVLVLSSEDGEGAVHFRSRAFMREWDIFNGLWRFRPDVVHIHGRIHFIVPALIYKMISGMRPRIVFTFHSQPYLGNFIEGKVGGKPDYVGVNRWIARFLLGRCDSVTTVSRSIVENLNKHYAMAIGRFVTIASGSEEHAADEGIVAKFKSKYEFGGAFPILSTIGVFSWDWKVAGHQVALESLVLLRRLYPQIRLLIAGDGNYRGYLEMAAARLGVADRVVFLGNIDNVNTLLAASDIYVHMAMNEGCPLAVVEAMRAGKPIVAARRGGIPEIIEDGVSGMLIEPTPEALAKVVGELLGTENRRKILGMNAASCAEKHLSWNAISCQYRVLYEASVARMAGLAMSGDLSHRGATHESR